MPAAVPPAAPAAVPAAVPARRRAVLHRHGVVVLLAVLTCLSVLAQPVLAAPPGVPRHALTAAEERVVLRLVDDICGDTWCEGEHAFRFQSFTCHPRRGCLLRVRLAPWSTEPLRWSSHAGRVPGFHRFADMVHTDPGGGRSLQPRFLDAVGRAVRVMTGSVR